MTALVNKIKNSFSDLWFNVDLFLDRFRKKKDSEPEEAPKPELSDEQQAKINSVLAAQTSGDKDLAANYPKVAEIKKQMVESREKKKAEKQERIKNIKLPFALRTLRLSQKARLNFYDELATLVGSGVTLIDALSVIQAQERNKTVKKLYAEMIHQINTGLSLAEAMEIFPHVFPKMQAALVAAAEASGNLKGVLSEMVEEMEASQEFMRKVTGAMVYPLILIFLALGLVIGMMTFVIPKISAMYDQANVTLPGITQAVINISDFMINQWPFLLAGTVIGLIAFWAFFFKITAGIWIREALVSMIPVAGKISKYKNIRMFAANMGMLMNSGVLITEAFAITRKTIPNLHYQSALEKIREGVVLGREVSQMMGLIDIKAQKFKEHPLFPLQVAQLIHIGETTGTISEMLFKIKKNYHKSIEYILKNISTVIEPVMILIMATMVGTILMAVMLPFFYIGSTIS
jgi:type II secretory pathway component PulF